MTRAAPAVRPGAALARSCAGAAPLSAAPISAFPGTHWDRSGVSWAPIPLEPGLRPLSLRSSPFRAYAGLAERVVPGATHLLCRARIMTDPAVVRGRAYGPCIWRESPADAATSPLPCVGLTRGTRGTGKGAPLCSSLAAPVPIRDVSGTRALPLGALCRSGRTASTPLHCIHPQMACPRASLDLPFCMRRPAEASSWSSCISTGSGTSRSIIGSGSFSSNRSSSELSSRRVDREHSLDTQWLQGPRNRDAATTPRRKATLAPESGLAPEYELQLDTAGSPEPPTMPSEVLACCEPHRAPLKVAVLLSGGVDSSVALRLLHAAGHECTAYYLKIWFQEDFRNFWEQCPWEEDLAFAQAVCDQIGADLRVVHLTDEYWSLVVSHCMDEIRAGRTPNPDMLCNSRVKFGAFFQHLDFRNFDRVASGHYARVDEGALSAEAAASSERGPVVLSLTKDAVKDQTYFLSHLSQEQLSHVMFPLGALSKAEVREWAARLDLPNRARKDSQGICFLGKVKFNEFLAERIGEREGRILEAESGRELGRHRGFWFYTIGQRQGIRLPDGPWYVVAKDTEHNVVFVSKDYYSGDKSRRQFWIGDVNWLTPSLAPRVDWAGVQCKVRHGPHLYACSVDFVPTAHTSRGGQDAGLEPPGPPLSGEQSLGQACSVPAAQRAHADGSREQRATAGAEAPVLELGRASGPSGPAAGAGAVHPDAGSVYFDVERNAAARRVATALGQAPDASGEEQSAARFEEREGAHGAAEPLNVAADEKARPVIGRDSEGASTWQQLVEFARRGLQAFGALFGSGSGGGPLERGPLVPPNPAFKGLVTLEHDDQGLAAGQYAVFYIDRRQLRTDRSGAEGLPAEGAGPISGGIVSFDLPGLGEGLVCLGGAKIMGVPDTGLRSAVSDAALAAARRTEEEWEALAGSKKKTSKKERKKAKILEQQTASPQ